MFKRIFFDALFYLAIPLLVWNLFREDFGDYYTILIGMVPGLLYTIIKAIVKKEWSITGIFFLSLISMNFVFNLFSETAEQELWNIVYMNLISIAFYLITILIKKPIGMYFFIDYAHVKGVSRGESKKLYSKPENFHHFVKFTLFLTLREVVIGTTLAYLINEYGVEAFNTIQITNTVLGYALTGIMIYYIYYISKHIKEDEDKE